AICTSHLVAQEAAGPPVHHSAQSNPRLSPSTPLKVKMRGPEVQNLMLGTWAIKVEYPHSPDWPDGGTGEGVEVWWSGPGGYSVIEEYYEKNAKGETQLFIPNWWDSQAEGQRFLGCCDTLPDGCTLSKNVAKWE